MKIYELPNSKIDDLICKYYKQEKYRNILRDRFIAGMTYRDMLIKYDANYELYSERKQRELQQKLSAMCNKFRRFAENEDKE